MLGGSPPTHTAPAQSSKVVLAVCINSSAAVVLANSTSLTALANISMTSASRLLVRVHPSRRALEKSSRETASFFFSFERTRRVDD